MRQMKHLRLTKESFDVIYSTQHHYPVCVVETFNGLQDVGIDRNTVNEPFQPDPEVPKINSATMQQYHDYMQYGGSYGHNAPAGFHKSSLEAYKSTFLLSNICPQEVVFNSGLWRLLETWHKALVKKHKKVTILTGSIGSQLKTFNDSTMCVPTHMYKIAIIHATAKTTQPNKPYIAAFLMSNKPGMCSGTLKQHQCALSHYLIHPVAVRDLIKSTMQFDINDVMPVPIHDIKHHIKDIEPVQVPMTASIKAAIKSSVLYGKLVYSKSLQELERHYQQGKEQKLLNHYHELYYTLAKQRIGRQK